MGVSSLTSSILDPYHGGNTPAAAYCSPKPDESHKLAFLGMLGAPRVRRLSTSPSAEEQLPGDSYKRAVLPRAHATETRIQYCALARNEGAGARHTGVSTQHTEAIRRMYHSIYRKAYPPSPVAIVFAARATVR